MGRIFVGLVLPGTLALAGCSSSAGQGVDQGRLETSAAEPTAVSAAPAESDPPLEVEGEGAYEEDREQARTSLIFGETYQYENLNFAEPVLDLTVSAPVAMNIGDSYAEPAFPNNYLFAISVTNIGQDNIDILSTSEVISGSQAGSPIHDASISGSPSVILVPGQSIEWNEGWSVADPADISFQISPLMNSEAAIYSFGN